jgi:acyl-CoA thioesterase I
MSSRFLSVAVLVVPVLVLGACRRDEAAEAREVGAPAASSDTLPVAATPAAPAAAAEPAVASRRTILFAGTSLTAGFGLDAATQSYPALIQRLVDSAGLSYQVVNAGVSGETSAALRQRIDWLLRRPADVIVIETGANDGLRGLTVASLRANIQAVLDRVRHTQPRARVFLVQMEAPPNLGARYTSEFRNVFPELAGKNRVGLIPFLLEGVAGDPALNQDDGIHPNPSGARVVAATVWKVLAPALASPAQADRR